MEPNGARSERGLWADTKSSIQRVTAAFILFGLKFLLAVLLVASDLGLEYLAGLVLEHGSPEHKIVGFVLDVAFVGSAIIVAVTGVIVVAVEVIRSSLEYIKRWEAK